MSSLVRRAARAVMLRYVRSAPRRRDLALADRRVTILLSSAWGMGGTIRTVLNLAAYLAPTHEVEIITAVRTREHPFFGAFPAGVRVTPLRDVRRSRRRPTGLQRLLEARSSVLYTPHDRLNKRFSLWTDLELVRLMRRRTGVVIGTRPGFNVLLADLRLPGVRTVGQEHMHLRHWRRTLQREMQRAYPHLDRVVVLTHRDAEVAATLTADSRRVRVIPNAARRLEGVPADASSKTVLAAGRLTPQKNYPVLVRAWEQVARDHPDWRLRICGKGRHGPKLARMVEQLALEGSISLEGPIADMAEEMSKASIFAMSSRFEGFPLTLVEAMSKGMAVISFDCPTGPADLIEDRVNGLLIPPNDVDAFARGLATLMADEDLRRRLGTAAVETSRQYAPELIGERWRTALRELVQPS